MTVRPFQIDIPQAEVDDLGRRLTDARWAIQPASPTAHLLGLPESRLRSLFTRWQSGYDWYAQQTELNQLAQVETVAGGSQRLHAVHVRSEDPGAVPLLLLHGWPSTFAEYRYLVGPLTNPAPGTPAFHVVAPSLPGFGFSSPALDTGWNMDRIARAMIELMDQLGINRFMTHGSDMGQAIAEKIAVLVPDRVLGLHLTVGGVKLAALNRDKGLENDREQLAVRKLDEYMSDKSGYSHLQATRPETLAYALTDSPLGQLAWIAEKFDEWGDPDHPVSDHDILTTVSLYWFTRTAASSGRFYSEEYARMAPVPYVSTPTAGITFPHDIVPAVRRWAEQAYNVTQWTEAEAGAHFAALEVPGILADSLRRFARSLVPAVTDR